jgi:hypothetical protein
VISARRAATRGCVQRAMRCADPIGSADAQRGHADVPLTARPHAVLCAARGRGAAALVHAAVACPLAWQRAQRSFRCSSVDVQVGRVWPARRQRLHRGGARVRAASGPTAGSESASDSGA